jgi:hypothetical protein
LCDSVTAWIARPRIPSRRHPDASRTAIGRDQPSVLNSLDALEQVYRDLRNYAVHRPDESFDESRVDRAIIGTLLEACVDYFRRLYEVHAAVNAIKP